MNKAEFYQAYVRTHQNEIGYAFDPDDPGGETWDGIARVFWPNWDGWKIIDEAKKQFSTHKALGNHLRSNHVLEQLTTDFYRVNFWEYLKLGVFGQELANKIFDTAVNFGRKRAIRYLQMSLNLLNNNQKIFPDLEPDGIIGNKTFKAVKAHLETSKWKSRNLTKCNDVLMDLFISFRVDGWKKSATRNPRMEKYVFGWMSRI